MTINSRGADQAHWTYSLARSFRGRPPMRWSLIWKIWR